MIIPVILPYNYAADDARTANIPGVPREDFPIYAEVNESGFVCDSQVDGADRVGELLRLFLVSQLLLLHCRGSTLSQ